MNEIDPVLVRAALFTGAPAGRRTLMSPPTPPPSE